MRATPSAVGANRIEVYGFSRLYPRWLVGDRPRSPQARCREGRLIDTLAPRTWRDVARTISTDVLLVQYWTPVVVPALLTILSRAHAHRRLLVCHNAKPHERVPGARVLFEALLRHCDAVIFHSRATFLSAFAGATAQLPSAIVPMPLLLSPSGPLRRPPELGSGSADDAEIVALVGHIRGYKGLGVLDRAWDEVARRRPTARLVVAGEPVGRAGRELARSATRSQRVTVISRYLEDAELRWVLANARVVVLPYTDASQSGVLPLALRLAEQVVVSDAGGLGEQLSQLGSPGAAVSCVPAGESAALARALHAALCVVPDAVLRAARHGESVQRRGRVELAALRSRRRGARGGRRNGG